MWEPQLDEQGRHIGRQRVTDRNGNVVRKYVVPDGFRNMPTSGNQDSYTYFEEDAREPYRQPNGESVTIQPGQAVVFEPDGSVTVLTDEYSQYLFGQSHDVLTEE